MTVKVPVLPLELVLTLLSRMNVLPSLPEGLEKNWRVKVRLGVLLRRPSMVVSPIRSALGIYAAPERSAS